MNKEAILKVAETIASHPSQFDMETWGYPDELLHTCDSAGCIGGWTDATFYPSEYDTAANRLGLTVEQGDELFYPASNNAKDLHGNPRVREDDVWRSHPSPYNATAADAVQLLHDIVDGKATFACDVTS